MTRVLSFICFFGIFGMLSAQVTLAERNALQAFYTATNGATWTSENDAIPGNDWDFSGPVTNAWYGLTIAGGHVVAMDMNPINYANTSNIQSGFIPDELADLEFLTTIDISASGLTGTLPVSITTLPNLVSLNVWYNDLTGNIPIEVTDMTQLSVLHLGDNNFTGTIYPEYGDLVNLTYLNLSDNDLTGTIPVSLGNLVELRSLILGQQQLTGNLPVSLRNLTNLIELSIQSTRIDGNLPEEYSELTNLQILRLKSYTNAFIGGLTGSIPNSYGNLVNLRTLDLWGNALSGTLPVSLSNLVNMEYFSVANNQISGTLPASYSSWTNIIRFEVYNNDLEGTIPDSYSSFTQIENFSADTNNLTGSLSPNFSQWVNLETFNVSRNDLSGNFPQSYNQWTNLEVFNAFNNSFSGTIPATYNQWNNLSNFNVNNNQLEGTVPDFTVIPTFTQNLTISDNRFQFGDFENEFPFYDANFSGFRDNPQAKVNDILTLNENIGDNVTLTTTVSGSQNHYQWFKDGMPITGAPDSPTLVLNNIEATDAGVYYAEITSDIVTDLTLIRNDITIIINCVIPTVDDPVDVNACLSYTLPALSADNFYYTQTNAGGTQLNAGDVITTSQTLFVYAGTTGCSDENEFDILIGTAPTADDPTDVNACLSYTLPTLSADNFYYTQTNAGGTQLNAGDVITTSQTLFVYAGTTGCSDENEFDIQIETTPTADDRADVNACLSYTLPALSADNFYYTQTNAGGTQLNAGDVITTSQTLFVYAGTTGCSDENEFDIQIGTAPTADAPIDVNACLSYTLPALSADNFYYTQINAGGTQLNAGDVITTSQTLFVYAGTNGCSDENEFDIQIGTALTADDPADVNACLSYTLPTLSADNFYYTQTNAGGTQLNAGDVITTSQTLYMYAGTTGCSDENEFNIQIENPTLVDSILDMEVCENHILPVLNSGNYFTQPNGTGTELYAGDIINTTQTIYIFDDSASCSNENSFTITIDPLSCEETPVPEPEPEISCTIDFPNFFTPNNDGVHDRYVPITDVCSPAGTLSIHNRYGQLLFQTKSLDNTWDGKFNGKPLPSSDYWYRFENAENNEVITGHFSLKR
ncbi:gliding motility-associated C-terminal domain-containing protein [Maribacter aquivivus]|uniref:Gliding motility-associated C-terminal domain-containing protein n=1 Tax=Maribacter aquivivus TaxID=228958 RepID=A0A1M6N4L7_9FLAO|nr:T9SS type B sorting domain-containing protein [Maribacter aquivivus]SHJ90637.1 gliding motility-associated C-terminal domain-containing protein [Maribacter aquivivus]